MNICQGCGQVVECRAHPREHSMLKFDKKGIDDFSKYVFNLSGKLFEFSSIECGVA